MGSVIMCGAEGEYAAFSNTLDVFGADTQRDGSVRLLAGDEMFMEWTPAPSNITWVHIRSALTRNSTNNASNDTIRIRTDAGVNLVRMIPVGGVTPTTPMWLYIADTPSTEVLWGESFVWGDNTWVTIDIKIEISTTTITDDTVTYTFYRDGVRRMRETYVAVSAFSAPEQMILACKTTTTAGTNGEHTYYQDVIVTDDVPTPSMELVTMRPNVAGAHTDFNQDYTAVDEQGYDPTDTIVATAVNDKESWTFSTPGYVLGDRLIYGVAMVNVTQLDLNGTFSDFRPFVRISATDYNGSGLNSEVESALPGLSMWTQNPNTAQDWDAPAVTALEAGIEAI